MQQHVAGSLFLLALLYCVYQFTTTRQTVYLALSVSLVLLLLIFVGSFLILVSFRYSVRFIKLLLGWASRLARPVVDKISASPRASVVAEWLLKFSFWWSFIVLLAADRVMRRLLAFWVGRHAPTDSLYTVVNTSDPEFDFSPAFEEGMVHKPGVYDHEAAVACAVASKLCYEDPLVIGHELKRNGYSDYRPILYHNTVGFIACKNEHVVLTFRGTSPLNLGNLWTDLEHELMAFPHVGGTGLKGLVHAGFYKALGHDVMYDPERQQTKRVLSLELSGENIVQVLRDAVFVIKAVLEWLVEHLLRHVRHPHDLSLGNVATDEDNNAWMQAHRQLLEMVLNPPDGGQRHLWISGHSLGAGLATIFAAKLVQHSSPLVDHVAGIYTYGMPRIGDADLTASFPEELAQRMFHHVLDNDIIARIPHIQPYASPPGHLVHIAANRTLVVHADHQVPSIVFTKMHGLLNPNIIRRLPTETSLRVMLRFTFPFFFNDHFPGDYVRAIKDGRLGSAGHASGSPILSPSLQ